MTSLKEGQKQACKSGQQRLLQLMDMRYPSHTGIRSAVTADVESLAWDPNDQNSFVVSLQDGTVQGFDVRGAASNPDSGCKPCFTLHAHDEAVTTVSFNTSAPKLLATGSIDKMVKLWDLSNSQPSCVASNNPKAWVDVDVARQWVEKQGLLPSSEELPLTESFPGRGGLLAARKKIVDAKLAKDFQAVLKEFKKAQRHNIFCVPSTSPFQRLGGLSYFVGAEEKDERVLVHDLGSLTSIHNRFGLWSMHQDILFVTLQQFRLRVQTMFVLLQRVSTNLLKLARELFYYLKGGQVDYREEHSNIFGHSQFGRIYEEGHYPEWDEDHLIHFVGHSARAQVVRVLQQMLADMVSLFF